MIDFLKYFDRPWAPGEYDCWSFVREIYRCELKIELPLICIDAGNLPAVIKEFKRSDIRGMFDQVEHPVDFDVVLIGRRDSSHVGLYFSPGKIFHNDRKTGVLLQSVRELENSIKGFYRCKLL